MKRDLRIVFMGTPEFAVPSLKILVDHNYKVVAVVTAPDKPAGRGLQLQQSAVKQYAASQGIPVLQPVKLKDPAFLEELKSYQPNLFIIVAFRMLPEAVWQMPEYGSFNLHGSLLPAYRGAAPINWAIINGETKTGLTTFFLRHEIDTGNIIFQKEIPIGYNQTAGELHDEMMEAGAQLVLGTVAAIEQDSATTQPQASPPVGKEAPKIFRDDCKINWAEDVEKVFNLIRGLSPYPGAWTSLNGKVMKIYRAQSIEEKHEKNPGVVETDGKTYFRIAAQNGWIEVKELKMEGKKEMSTEEFLRGFQPAKFHIS